MIFTNEGIYDVFNVSIYLLFQVMYRKANGKCVICLDKMAVDALLPCRHRSVCGSCRHETDECPICHVQFPTK